MLDKFTIKELITLLMTMKLVNTLMIFMILVRVITIDIHWSNKK